MSKAEEYEGHPESKSRLRIQSVHPFCCSQSLVSGVQCDVEKLPHAVVRRTLSRGKCKDSCGHGYADWESRRLRSLRYYSFSAGRWDLRLACRRGKLSRGIVLLDDSARPHSARQTSLAACAVPLGHLQATSIQSGPGTVGQFPVSKNKGTPCW